jgi:hypothetical protein
MIVSDSSDNSNTDEYQAYVKMFTLVTMARDFSIIVTPLMTAHIDQSESQAESLSWRSVFVWVYPTHPLPYYYVLHL